MKCVTNFLPLLFYSILISAHVKQSIAGKSLNKMKCTVYNAAINVFDLLCEPRFPYTVPDCNLLRRDWNVFWTKAN
ncbi:hypothetical protein TNIN_107581 [Trichonephila inaurata madagascariensis]|uniref:Secreted protein n=1 Tax=Trichonephila inaurata madagascariensis TaxID=2747483 RepID=A0A8X6WPR9_9ARAC|nr:hypothetical protein TNIN_107581 [Trichonephila inaurata madagascariensis]